MPSAPLPTVICSKVKSPLTLKPSPNAGLTFEYGSFNSFSSEGFVTGSVAPGLTGRLSFATEQGGGWQYNRLNGDPLGDKDKVAVRGQLEWNPWQGLDFRLTGHWALDKSDEIGLHLLDAYTHANGGAALGPPIPADTLRQSTAQINQNCGVLCALSRCT